MKRMMKQKGLNRPSRFARLLGLVLPLLPETAAAVTPVDEATPKPFVTVAVSTSMPLEHVRGLAQSLAKTGGRLVVRGAPLRETSENYFALPLDKQESVRADVRKGMAALARMSVHGVSVAIDPGFFKRHQIDAVPVVVVETTTRQVCDACKTFDGKTGRKAKADGTAYRVRGDVTLDYALRTLAAQTTGADQAAIVVLLDRLEGERRQGGTP